MSKRDKFIEMIDDLLSHYGEHFEEWEYRQDALDYWEEFKNKKATNGMTENGERVLKCMQEHESDCDNIFKASVLGDYLDTSGRSVASTIKKLISDGYVSKVGQNPVVYSLTDSGRTFDKFEKI